MSRSLVSLAALALALAPLQALAQDAPAPVPGRVLTVLGQGEAARAPDLALLSLGVSAQAPTAAEAMGAMGEGLTAVLAAVTAAGIPEADLQTGQLTLEAAYDYDSGSAPAPVTGYIATEVVTVTVRDLDALGGLLDAATGAGANRIDGIAFALEDQAGALAEARRAAIADARVRAADYAGAAGLAVGDILRIDEGGASVGPLQQARFDMASVPVLPGQVSTMATVSVTFALE
jgi:uncharacterized protein YggE